VTAEAADAERAPTTVKLGRRELAFYALPWLANNFQTLPVLVYLTGFYSTDMGLPLAVVGLAISATRILDIFTDILLGIFSDKLRTRWGRRKPMVAMGLPFAMLSVWMLLVPPDNVSIAYLIFWILVFNMATSIIEVPYTAWGAELSRDYDGRTRVTSWRTIAATIGSFIALSIPFALQRAGFDGNRPVLMGMAMAYVVSAPLFFLMVLRFVQEPAPRDARQAALPLRESMMVIWRSKAFRVLALGLMLFVGGKAINSAMNMVFIREVVDAAKLFPTMLVLENVAGLAAIPFWMWMGTKLGKAQTMMIAALWSGLWSLPLFMLSEGDGWQFVFLTTMRGVSLTAWTVLIYSMIADAVDVDTLAAGRERTGVFFGATNFVVKASAAIGILVGTSLPAMAGFQPSDTVHAPESLLAFKLVYAVLAPLMVVAAALVFGRFPISRQKQVELRTQIEARAQATA